MYTDAFEVPTIEELTVPEVKLTTASLLAGSFHFGQHCKQQTREFALCKDEEKDPRSCLKEGKDVTACAFDFFKNVKRNCEEEFNQYAKCIEYGNYRYGLHYCRNTQVVYDKCMLEKLAIDRPNFQYYLKIKTHETDRPEPASSRGFVLPEFKDTPLPGPPAEGGREASRTGPRLNFFS